MNISGIDRQFGRLAGLAEKPLIMQPATDTRTVRLLGPGVLAGTGHQPEGLPAESQDCLQLTYIKEPVKGSA